MHSSPWFPWIAAGCVAGCVFVIAPTRAEAPKVGSPPEVRSSRPPLPPAPRPPLPKSAVEQFRELLAASTESREAYLARKKPESAAVIRDSLREFDALTPNERELRLRLLQLHHQLIPLLGASAEERAATLASLPAEDRALLEDRLRAWDDLPAEVRQVALVDKRALNYFIQARRTPDQAATHLLAQVPDNLRVAVEAQIARWQELPEEVRRRTTAEFEKFFTLTDVERERTLRRLSQTERRQMADTLKLFAALPITQRERCLRAFGHFSGMTANERAAFLQSAARWNQMDPDERAVWRRLVTTLSTPPPLPPLPPHRVELVATNPPPSSALP